MEKIFIVTEQEIGLYGSQKQSDILDYVNALAEANPHADIATLVEASREQIGIDQPSWSYKAPADTEQELVVSESAEQTFEQETSPTFVAEELPVYQEAPEEPVNQEPVLEEYVPTTVEETVNEEPVVEEETSEEHIVSRRPNNFRGLFSEAGKLDRP